MTLPLLGAMANVSPEEAEVVRRKVSDIASHPQFRDEIVSFVKANGGLEYAVRRLEGYIDDAVKALEVLPESYEKQYLVELAHYTGKRNM
jgi:octaprenyl-diphosphate synthase